MKQKLSEMGDDTRGRYRLCDKKKKKERERGRDCKYQRYREYIKEELPGKGAGMKLCHQDQEQLSSDRNYQGISDSVRQSAHGCCPVCSQRTCSTAAIFT